MDDFLTSVLATPQTTLLTVAGILFLLLAVAGSVVGKINVPPERQKWAGIIGGLLLLAGILISASKPDTPLHGTVVSGSTTTKELKKDMELLREMIEESQRKEKNLSETKAGEQEELKKKLEEQRAMTERLRAAQEETERIFKERVAVSELRHDIMLYYNNKGPWAGTFVMERIDRLLIKGNAAHVRYKYSPIQGNKQRRSDIGYDQRIFKLKKDGDKYKVVGIGGHMSARF